MKKSFYAFLVCATALLLWMLLPGRSQTKKEMTSNVPSTQSAAKHKEPAPLAPAASAPISSVNPRVLSKREFNEQFKLTATDSLKFSHGVSAIFLNLLETRGSKASVSEYDGTHVRLTLPPLDTSSTEIDTLILRRLTESLSEKKAIEIMSDPDGAATVYSEVCVDRFANTVSIYFTKVKNYQVGEQFDASKRAEINAEQVETVPLPEPHDIRTRIVGFNTNGTQAVGIGWNALSKVPSGYFRADPILGVQSAPRTAPTVIEDHDTGNAIVLDAEYPGSVTNIPKDGS